MGLKPPKAQRFISRLANSTKHGLDLSKRKQGRDNPDFKVRTANENKSLCITCPDETNVPVYFNVKDEAKTQISVQHGKLEKHDEVARRKSYWENQFASLKKFLK